MTKHIFTLVLLLGFFSHAAIAQGGPESKKKSKQMERMKSKKIAYITDALELSPEESEKFWPLYNQLKKEKDALRGERKRNDYANMTNEEALQLLNASIERQQKEIELKEKYNSKFLEFLSAKKLLKLGHVERKFKHEMLNDIKSRYSSRGRSRDK